MDSMTWIAVISIAVSVARLSIYGLAGVLTPQVVAFALLIGFVTVPGAFLAKRFVERMPVHVHTAILDVVVVVGYDEEAEFGFRKADVAQPRATAAVYVVAEDGELAFGGPSFTEFAKDLARRVAKARARRAVPWWKRWFSRGG